MILVGGEALIDLVQGDTDELAAHPGGAAFTTARAVARLGRPVAYLGRLSTDRFGRRLEALLRDDGVELSCVVHTDEPTTLALAEFGAGGSAQYRFYERATAAPGLHAADALAVLPDRVDILHVGTLGLTLEPVASALEAVVERVAGRALVVVDPNVRPWAIADATAYRDRLRRVLARSGVVKLSAEDVQWLVPEREPVDAVRALLAGGPALGLLTRGAEGAVVVTRDAAVEVSTPPVRVVDTIGAGDAFGGGFLAWWDERGTSLADLDAAVEATRFACLVAARTCERAGAVPPLRSEL
jgi:fructokinase